MRLTRVRFTLSVMMALVAILGLVLAHVVNRGRAQRDAVAALRRMRAIVLYDYQFRGGVELPGGEARHPSRLGRWVGVDFAHDVTKVTLWTGPLGAVPLLGDLPGLESFGSRNKPLSRDDLAGIRGIARLRELDFAFSDLGDDGVAQLVGMPELRRLNLAGTQVTDRAIGLLARFRRLEDLDLFGTRLTQVGINRLAGIAGLRRVRLNRIDTELVLAGLPSLTGLEALEIGYEMNFDPDDPKDLARSGRLMACLRGLPRLRELKIDGFFDDATLVEVAKPKGLEGLNLQLTMVTDAGLRHVATMPHLKRLDVSFTGVTPSGIAALRAMRPGLDIKF